MSVKISPFATEFVLLYLPAKILCVVPFNFNLRSGKASNSRPGSFVAILVGFSYYAFHLHSAYQQMISQQDTNFVSKLIDSYNQYAGCSILMIIILNSSYHQSKVVHVINTIQQVDDFLKEQSSREKSMANRFRLQFHGPAYLFVTAICTMEYYFCIMFIKDTPTFSTYCLLMCYVPLLVHITTELVFCAILSCITVRLSQLRRLEPSLVTFEIIRAFKRTFDALHEAAEQLNESFQLPILLLTFHQFTAITTLSYDLAVAIVKYDYLSPGYDTAKIIVQLESSGGWSLFFIAETCILCLICERFKKELAHTGSRLLLATNLSVQHGHRRWTQLQLYGTTMKEFVISACGLFHVDMHLLYNMIGVITTYLIILVQFDVAQRQTITTGN